MLKFSPRPYGNTYKTDTVKNKKIKSTSLVAILLLFSTIIVSMIYTCFDKPGFLIKIPKYDCQKANQEIYDYWKSKKKPLVPMVYTKIFQRFKG